MTTVILRPARYTMMVVIAKPMPDRSQPDTRSRMIISATELFREHGYSGTGFRDVVEHSGAPRGSIYHHFPGGKTELAQEAVRLADAVVAARIERAAADGDPQAMIDGFADGWRRQLQASDFRAGCPVVAVAVEADAAFEHWERLFANCLRRSGVPRARARRIATLAVSAIEGAVIQCRVARSTTPLDDVRRELGAIIESARRPVASRA
jgi:AcrR family transcriptional regulator